MRVFAAVPLPTAQAGHLSAALPAALPATAPDTRLVGVERWHLTLAFYGQLTDRQLSELEPRLRRAAARTAPLRLWLAGAGTFPRRPEAGRLLWVGVAGDVERLSRLAAAVAAAGRRVGAAMEDRPYRAHLTVGRARSGVTDWTAAVAQLAGYTGPAWTAGAVVLYESEPVPRPRYREIATLDCAAGSGQDSRGTR
jgi:2'-5' RNA ligase